MHQRKNCNHLHKFKKSDKMTTYPSLIITVVLINTVQWINSIEQHKHNLNWDDHLLVSKNNYHTLPNTPVCTTLRDMDYQIMDNDIKNPDGRVTVPTSNLKNYEYSIFLRNTQFGKEFPQIKSLLISKPIETRMDKEVFDPELKPDPHDIQMCSKNQTFCTNIKNYPREKIFKILNESNSLMLSPLFGKDPINTFSITSSINTNLKDVQPLCFLKERKIYPEVALNTKGEWRYIVQDVNNSKFSQAISIIQCKNVGMKCNFLELPSKITTCCIQKYIQTKLVAIDSSRKVYYEKFELPSCCKCKYTNL